MFQIDVLHLELVGCKVNRAVTGVKGKEPLTNVGQMSVDLLCGFLRDLRGRTDRGAVFLPACQL